MSQVGHEGEVSTPQRWISNSSTFLLTSASNSWFQLHNGGLATPYITLSPYNPNKVSTPQRWISNDNEEWEDGFSIFTFQLHNGGLATLKHHTEDNKTYQGFCQYPTSLKRRIFARNLWSCKVECGFINFKTLIDKAPKRAASKHQNIKAS